MIRIILRAILNGFLAYVVTALILFNIARLLPIASGARTTIIVIICVASGATVLAVMSRLQQNILNLAKRTLLIQILLSVFITALFLLTLMIPVKS
jgi:hypothetical protein